MPTQPPHLNRPAELIHLRQLQLPAELWELVERRVAATGRSPEAVVREAVREWLRKNRRRS